MTLVTVFPIDGELPAPTSPPQPSFQVSALSAPGALESSGVARPAEASPATSVWTYELRPAQELPVVDLSVSIKSRFLSPRMLVVFVRVVSYRRTLFACAVFSLLSYPVSLVITPRVGRPLAIISTAAGVPVVFAGASLLRYELVKLLLSTYDTLFFLGMAVTTLATIGLLLRDARIGTLVTTLIGLLPNIFVDANLRAVRRLTVITGVEVFAMIIVAVELMLDMLPEVQSNAAIISYGSHSLPAKMYATNGLATLIVLLLRNFYRKREAIFQRGNPTLQRCVTYRVRLKLAAVSTNHSRARSNLSNTVATFNTTVNDMKSRKNTSDPGTTVMTTSSISTADIEAAYVQRLCYAQTHQVVDVRNTVVPGAFTLLERPASSTTMLSMLFKGITVISLAATMLAATIDKRLVANGHIPIVRWVGFALTVVHITSVAMLSQRDLLRAVVFSFDFGYLSAHVVLLSLCLCDIFRWGQHSVVIFTVCLWLHAFMCIDALTPPVRARLGIRIRVTAVMLAIVSLSGTIAIVYLLIFDPVTSASAFDRPIWTVKVPGAADVVVSIIPFFYSGLLNAFLLILRLVFRAATYANDELVLVDGPVVFFNCFHSRSALVVAAATSAGRDDTRRDPVRQERGHNPLIRGATMGTTVLPVPPLTIPASPTIDRRASQ
jgi:hypothetical protein